METPVTDGYGQQHRATQPHDRLLLISCPRTASNLLIKVLALSNQPNVFTTERGGYVMWEAFMTASLDGRMFKPLDQWTAADMTKLQEDCQECLDRLEELTEKARCEGKMFVSKEHASWFFQMSAIQEYLYGKSDISNDGFQCTLKYPEAYGPSQHLKHSPNNQTIFADEYLRTWRAAFIIRHPALVFPSVQRVLSKLLKDSLGPDHLESGISVNMTFRWPRLLFDLLREQSKTTPAVLDANDLINNPSVVAKFSQMIGLDPSRLQFEWDTQQGSEDKQEEDRQKMTAIMLDTLHASSGMVKDKAPDRIDLAVEVAKWKEEFGERVAGIIEQAVIDAMPDYDYLLAQRVKLDDHDKKHEAPALATQQVSVECEG